MTIAPDNSALQVFYGTLPLIGTAVLAIWNNNKRLDDLKTLLNKRIDDLDSKLNKRMDDLIVATNTGFRDVKDSIGRLDARVSDLEKTTRLVRS